MPSNVHNRLLNSTTYHRNVQSHDVLRNDNVISLVYCSVLEYLTLTAIVEADYFTWFAICRCKLVFKSFLQHSKQYY